MSPDTDPTGRRCLLRAGAGAGLPAKKHKKPKFKIQTVDFSNGDGGTTIPQQGKASHYPTTIQIPGTGLDGATVQSVAVTLNGFTHTYPNDLSIMLVGPGNAVHVVLMSGVGGDVNASSWAIGFADDGAGGGLTDQTALQDFKVYHPSTVGTPIFGFGASALAAFKGGPVAGTWSLYIYDEKTPDSGSISGWRITIQAKVPA